MDIYVCLWCGGPIIFRYRPPEVFHLCTGWDCWKQRQKEKRRSDEKRPIGKFTSKTPAHRRKQRLERARALYPKYLAGADSSRILAFVRTEFKAGRSDVVHDLLADLSAAPGGRKGQKDKRKTKLVCQIIRAPVWKEFAASLPPVKALEE